MYENYLTGNLKGTRAGKKASLSKLISVCSWCGMARNEDGSWTEMGNAEKLSHGLRLTHGICIGCLWKLSRKAAPALPKKEGGISS